MRDETARIHPSRDHPSRDHPSRDDSDASESSKETRADASDGRLGFCVLEAIAETDRRPPRPASSPPPPEEVCGEEAYPSGVGLAPV